MKAREIIQQAPALNTEALQKQVIAIFMDGGPATRAAQFLRQHVGEQEVWRLCRDMGMEENMALEVANAMRDLERDGRPYDRYTASAKGMSSLLKARKRIANRAK
jgi:hypothetical protein